MKRTTIIPLWVRAMLLFKPLKTAPADNSGGFMTVTSYKQYRGVTYILKVEHRALSGRMLAKTKDSRYTPMNNGSHEHKENV